MAITEIWLIHNESDKAVNIENRETPRDTWGDRGTVAAGDQKLLHMWIPWCTRAADFGHHHIDVFIEGRDQPYAIWQADLAGQDLVRVGLDGSWQNPGDAIAGLADVGGPYRAVRIDDQGLRLEKVVFGSTGQFPWPTAGTEVLWLWRPEPDWSPGVDPSQYTHRPDIMLFDGSASSLRPEGVVMGTITNTARLSNGDPGPDIRLWHDDPARYVDLLAGQETDAFAGTEIPGIDVFGAQSAWYGRAMNYSNVLLKKPLELTYTWTAADGSPPPPISIEGVNVDPPGADVQPETGEFVELDNNSDQPLDVGGWYLLDDSGARINIPPGQIVTPGRPFRIYTGPGTGTEDKVYAGRHRAVWTNNPGDTARLYDSNGEPIYQFRYVR